MVIYFEFGVVKVGKIGMWVAKNKGTTGNAVSIKNS